MKRALFFIITFLLSFNVYSQKRIHLKKDTILYSSNIGVNATSIFNKIFKNTDSTGISPFIIDYSRVFKKKYLIRGGMGLHFRNKSNQVEGFLDKTTEENWSVDGRIGIGKKIYINKRFSVDFTGDILCHFSAKNQIMDSGFDEIEVINQTSYFGIGPAAGFTYHLNPRLSLRSETAFYLVYGKNDSARLFKNFPELNDQNIETKILETIYYLPINLYLQFSF